MGLIRISLTFWLSLVACREIAFTPAFPSQFSINHVLEQDFSGSRFHGLTTFANLPYEECFSDSIYWGSYDIAILGAQFDTVRSFLLPNLGA
jgi:hypothetical protein